MKKNLVIFLGLALISASLNFLFTACSNEEPLSAPQPNNLYPAILGNQWEYKTTTTFEYYDTTGIIDSIEIMDLGNTIVKVACITDSLENIFYLARFEAYDVSTPGNINISWYSNSDSGLFVIAYQNAGATQLVLPKLEEGNGFAIEDLLKNRFMLLDFSIQQTTAGDSVLYFEPPRKVLHYPLESGTRWIELMNPFYRERFIEGRESIQVPAGIFNCFVVEVDWSINIEFTDFINLSDGLIKRRIYADSVGITTIGNPEPIGYAKFTSISELVGKNF